MPFPLLAALIGGAASLGGAAISSRASRRAGDIQQQTAEQNRELAQTTVEGGLSDFDQALQQATAALRQGGDQAAGYQQPYFNAGTGALNQLTNALGLNGAEGNQNALSAFTASPGYQFQLQQGVNALDRSAAARGNLYSGAQGRALTEYGQGVANQEFGNYLNRLAGVAGAGQGAAGTLSSLAGATQGAIADTTLGTAANRANLRLGGLNAITGANSDVGAAQAGGIINSANSWNQGLTNLSQLIGYGAGQGFTTPIIDRIRGLGATPVVT